MNKTTILENALIITMDSARSVIRSGYIEVKDGHISDIGSGPARDVPGSEVIDVQGALILPGFVNTHHHLADFFMRGTAPDYAYNIEWKRKDEHWKTALRINETETYAATMLSASELIRSGVTTTTDSLTAWRKMNKSEGALRAAHDSGLRVAHSVAFIDRSRMVPLEFQFAPKQARAEYERLRAKFEYGLVTVGSEPLSLPRASDELIKALYDPDGGLHAMHLSYSSEFAAWAIQEYGHLAIEHLDHLGVLDNKLIGAHPVYLNDREIEIYAQRNAKGSFCAVSNMLIGVGIMPMTRMREAGITIGLGLDYPNHGHNMFETMKLSILSQKSLQLDATIGTPGLALELATIEGAKALGMDHRIGSLEVGKCGDLIILDVRNFGSPHHAGVINLVPYAGSPSDVVSVMVNGEWLMRDSSIISFDEAAAYSLSSTAQRKVLKATGFDEDFIALPDGWCWV